MTTSPPAVTLPLSRQLEIVRQIARTAGAVVLSHYGRVAKLTKTHQAASSETVTEADRATQRHIVTELRKHFPNDGIIGEENDAGDDITSDNVNPAGRNWVIDPIDGTNNFVGRFGHFAVCIGLLDKGLPVLGVVYDPVGNVLYDGATGIGASVDGVATTVLQTPLTDGSILMLTSNMVDKQGNIPACAIRWITQTSWKVRVLGTAAIEGALVGAGIAHGAVTINGKLWDVAAAAAIVLAGGGSVVNLAGRDIFPFDLANYTGAKVPFIAGGSLAVKKLVADLRAG